MRFFKHTNFDFLRWRWQAIGLSMIVILAGFAVIASRGLPYGIEFEGGTAVIAQFERVPSVEEVRNALSTNYAGGGDDAVVQTYGDPGQRQIMVRVPQVGAESGTSLGDTAKAVEEALRKANLGKFQVVGTEIVGPAVGEELSSKALWATVLSLAGILLYIAFRFQFSFAVGAVVATIHDLLVTLAFLAFFQYDLTLNVIAAILTISGYSVNDTIVIFDRMRENLRSMRREPLDKSINVALNQTLSRTIITAGTTLLSAVALFLFGGEVLRGFAFTLIIGIVTGTYSSIFVAAAIVMFWNRKRVRAVAADSTSTVAGAGQGQTSRRPKSPRKARAS